jgi:hypothetical protein
MSFIKAGFSLKPITVERISKMADKTHRDKSAIVDIAIELLSRQEEFSELSPTAPIPTTRPYRKTSRSKIDPTTIKGVKRGLRSLEAA